MPNDKDTLTAIKRAHAEWMGANSSDEQEYAEREMKNNATEWIPFLVDELDQWRNGMRTPRYSLYFSKDKDGDSMLEHIKSAVSLAAGLDYDVTRVATPESVHEWLRYLLQQNEQQKAEIERLRGELERYEERRQTASIEVGKVLEENERLRGELEQVKAERDDYRKVLEWYADIDAYTVMHLGCSPMVMSDRGKLACDILYRYEKGDSQNEQGML